VNLGHEVHIITSNYPKENNLKTNTIKGVSIKRYPIILRILRNPIMPSIYKIGKHLNEYDVVHVHNEHSFSAIVIAYLRMKYKFPMIITQHGQLRFGNFLLDLIEKIYSRTIGKIIFRRADRIICLSQSDKKYVKKFVKKKDKIKVMPNAIDPAVLSISEKKDIDIISKYNIKNKRIVLFVGQIIKRKGINFFIRAIPHILKDTSKRDVVFLIVGMGDFLNKAEQMAEKFHISDSVVFTNKISFSELIQAYKSSNIYVLPSLSEGLPTTILEAMYFGLPVIATNIPGVKDHFKNRALLVPPSDEKRLAEAISYVLDNVDFAKTKSKEGKKLIEEKYTWDIVIREYCKVYKKLVYDMKTR